MKKTAFALIGALVLLAIVLLLDRHRDASRGADRPAFDTTQKFAVDYVKLALQKDTSVLHKINGQWVAAPDDFPVDTAKISKALGYLLGLQTRELVSDNPARLAEYGLDSTQAKHVEWRLGETKWKVVIGKTSGIDYGTTYWKWEDKPGVYATPGNFTWDLPARSNDWKDRSLLKFEPKDVATVSVDWRDSTGALWHYKLSHPNDTTTRMTEPESSKVMENVTAPIIAQANQFTVDDFVAPGDSEAAHPGLDTPAVLIKVQLRDGKSLEIKAGHPVPPFVLTQHPFRKDLIKVAAWRFDAFKKKPDQISGRETLQERPVGSPRPSAKSLKPKKR